MYIARANRFVLRRWVGLSAVMMWAEVVMADVGRGSEAGNVGEAGVVKMSVAQQFLWTESVLGNMIIWLLIMMSVVVVALAIHAWTKNRKSSIMPEKTITIVQQLLDDKNYHDAVEYAKQDDSEFGGIIYASLSQASYGFGAMENAIEEAGNLSGSRRMRVLEYLNVLGAIGPMIGLLGTVYGMIVAFQTIVETGGQPRPAELAAGISTALVTTFWGLIVGIPAIGTYFILRNKIETLITESMVRAELMIERFRPANGDDSGDDGDFAQMVK